MAGELEKVRRELATAKEEANTYAKRCGELVQRRNDLQEANNRYLERARNAEYAKVNAEQELITALQIAVDLREQLNEALDAKSVLQGDYDSLTQQHLEETTWLRMDVNKWKDRAEKFQRERAELHDKLVGTPCAEIRWHQERFELKSTIRRLRRLYNFWSVIAMGSTIVAVVTFIGWLIK